MDEKQTVVLVEDHLKLNHRAHSFRHLSTHEFGFYQNYNNNPFPFSYNQLNLLDFCSTAAASMLIVCWLVFAPEIQSYNTYTRPPFIMHLPWPRASHHYSPYAC